MESGRRFVMGDIHGSFLALKQCLSLVNFDYDKDMLIQLGDVVDRYDQSFECVEELLKIKNLISIKGNHDDWWYTFLTKEYHPGGFKYGFIQTLKSYGFNCLGEDWDQFQIKYIDGEVSTNFKGSDVPQTHLDFFKNQLNYFLLDRMLFVHGGFNRHYLLENQIPHTYYWNRELWEEAQNFEMGVRLTPDFSYADKRFDSIFIGHSPIRDSNPVPITAVNITNLDTWCGGEGRLTIMDIDTKEYWQSDYSKNLYTRLN